MYINRNKYMERNKIFDTNFLIPISLQPNVVTLNYVRSNNVSFKYLRFTPSGCKDLSLWQRQITQWIEMT